MGEFPRKADGRRIFTAEFRVCSVVSEARPSMRTTSATAISPHGGLKAAWHDATRALVFEPLEFLEGLAAMAQILFLPYSFLRNLRLKTEDFSPPTGCTPPSAAPTPATRFRQSTPTLATDLPPESPASALHCSSSTHYQSASLPSPSPDTCARPPS